MVVRIGAIALSVVAAALAFLQPASASTCTSGSSTSGCTIDLNNYIGSGSAPSNTTFVIVTLTTDGSNVDVSVAPQSGFGFVNTGAGAALGFDVGSSAVTITGLPTGFTSSTGSSNHLDGSGTWPDAVYCSTACSSGGGMPYTSTLSFVVDNVTVADFVNDPNNWLFVSDICTNVVAGDTCGPGGLTGDVVNGTQGIVTTPLPAGLVLFLVPLLGGGFLVRRRRHTTTAAVA